MDSYERSGLVFDVRDRGPADGEPAVLLHGFPQDGTSYDGIVPTLTAAGWRTLAPDQRGYSPGARPRWRPAYRLGELVADVVALLDAAGLPNAHVVSHDWGGMVAWALAAWHPERVRTLTVLSTPHPRAFLRAMPRGQLLRSYYIGLFQVPWLPERALLARDGAPLRGLLARSGLPEPAVERYVARMREPGALAGALNWYRALPLGARAPIGPVDVPTLYVWGSADPALGRRAAEATEQYVRGRYRFAPLDGVGHWVPETQPETVARLLLGHAAG